MTGVSIDAVYKNYGSVEVLHGLTADIPKGGFAVLVGPSGCGKSTLLRMIAGLEDVTDGTISIGDRVINDLEPKDRDIAMVFQNYALYPHMTVADNMGFSLLLRREARSTIRERVDIAARSLGLTDYLERFPRELSGGQRQRVAMGRAIVRDPEVFLFDEPLSNLDAKLRTAMRAELRELQQRLGTTTVYVTHDQLEAMTMADKIIVMNHGVIEQAGHPLEIYDRPANLFVADFIGSPAMNLIDATVVGEAGSLTLKTAAGDPLPLPAGADGLTPGDKVVCGIRPEHIIVGDTGLPVEIALVETTGAETLLTAHYGDRTVSIVQKDRLDLQRGALVHLTAEPGKVHLFDAASGARIASA